MTSLIRLPRKFYDDHAERDLPTPIAIRSNSQSVWVALSDANLSELLNDAEYYADKDMRSGFCQDSREWCYAAERLLNAYRNQTCDPSTK